MKLLKIKDGSHHEQLTCLLRQRLFLYFIFLSFCILKIDKNLSFCVSFLENSKKKKKFKKSGKFSISTYSQKMMSSPYNVFKTIKSSFYHINFKNKK